MSLYKATKYCISVQHILLSLVISRSYSFLAPPKRKPQTQHGVFQAIFLASCCPSSALSSSTQEPQFVPALRQLPISVTVASFRVCIASTMNLPPTLKQAQTVRPVFFCPRGGCFSGCPAPRPPAACVPARFCARAPRSRGCARRTRPAWWSGSPARRTARGR